MTIDLDEIRAAGKLLTLDQAVAILGTTEPMRQHVFKLDGTNRVEFAVPLYWQQIGNDDVRELPEHTVTDCTVRIDGDEPVRLTKEALLKMTSSIGLTRDYVMRTPGPFIQPQLNWWVKNHGVKQTDGMRLLVKDDTGVAFTKTSLSTFSNLDILEKVVEQARQRYHTDEFYVDYKIAHSLERTALRLIIPAYERHLDTARSEAGEDDRWSVGIQITNSLMGDPQTRLNISGYLFSWVCSNGAISNHATSGNYNRRVQGQDEDEVLDWVGQCTKSIFGDLEPELDEVQALTEVSLEGELSEVVRDVFKQFKVPVPARAGILNALVESDDLTGYGLMQAVTQTANDPRISDKVREATMRVGGVIPHTITDRCSSCHRVNLG